MLIKKNILFTNFSTINKQIASPTNVQTQNFVNKNFLANLKLSGYKYTKNFSETQMPLVNK